MVECLHVIALISGGKDSFYSLLHCLQNGHKVIALANLHPAAVSSANETSTIGEQHDLNSFMYQTVGHTVIPLYEQALGIPLYRQPIIGTAVQTGISYGHPDAAAGGSNTIDQGEDETESLVPLLKRIMAEHPSANALSSGAILSTYQRTRIESVALRLGLIPLSYLWQYPILPPASQVSLLEDMSSIRLDARIVKVASGGLDESFLWQNVASPQTIRRVEKTMKRFSTDGDGAVIGEGGEFESLVIDGPAQLFTGRIEVQEDDRIVVREGGGSAWLRIENATVVPKESQDVNNEPLRTPELLDSRFRGVLVALVDEIHQTEEPVAGDDTILFKLPSSQSSGLLHWTVTVPPSKRGCSITEEAEGLVEGIIQRLRETHLKSSNIISTLILLRRMEDFIGFNKVYSTLFPEPNPPARVTVSCGDTMPHGVNIAISLTVQKSLASLTSRKALHVQSRSYWAPANIGPYSQAISIPVELSGQSEHQLRRVAVAGQIPLVPHTMILPSAGCRELELQSGHPRLRIFKLQAVLALQHLWRIGVEMQVVWWSSVVAYLPRGTVQEISEHARIAGRAWYLLHAKDRGDDIDSDDNRDLWEEKYYAGMESRGGTKVQQLLPDWSLVESPDDEITSPPFFAVEVEELPRQSSIEWHAHLGIVGGPIQLRTKLGSAGWTIYQCKYGGAIQTTIALNHQEDVSVTLDALRDALDSLGHASAEPVYGFPSYVDASIHLMELGDGMVPCRSIWDGYGSRLAAVLVYDNL